MLPDPLILYPPNAKLAPKLVALNAPVMLIAPVPVILFPFNGKLAPSPPTALNTPALVSNVVLLAPTMLLPFNSKLPPNPCEAYIVPIIPIVPVPVMLWLFKFKLPPSAGFKSADTDESPPDPPWLVVCNVCVTVSNTKPVPANV